MLTDHDVFYAASDRYDVSTSGGSATTTGSASLVGDRYTFTITSAPAVEWVLGQIVKVTQVAPATGYAFFRVVARTTSPQTVTLEPVRTRSDTVTPNGSGTFASGSAITGSDVFTDVLTLVIDLSEATGKASMYNYVFAASCAATSGPSTAGGTLIRVLTDAQCDDPLYGTAIGDAKNTGVLGVYFGTNLANFVWYAQNLTPGQRYEYRLLVASSSTSAIARAEHPRILAIRTDSLIVQEQSGTATTTSTTFQSILSDSNKKVTTAGTYLVMGSWMQTLSSANASDEGSVRFRHTVGGTSSNYNRATWCPSVANEYRAAGWVSAATLSANEYLELHHAVEPGGTVGLTSSVKNAKLLIAALPETIADAFTHEITGATSGTLAANTWQDLVTSSAFTNAQKSAGTWIDIIHTGNTASQNLRPKFDSKIDADWEMRGKGYIEQPSVGTREFANFWIHRVERDATSPVNAIQIRPTAAGTFPHTNCAFTFLRQAARVRVTDGVPRLVAADVESGVVLKKNWSSGNNGIYTRPCNEFELVTRVIVNGTEYTRMSTSADATAAPLRWHWDTTNKILTVRIADIPYNGSNYTNPESDFVHVMAVSPYLVTRDGDVALRDNEGILRQYEARLAVVPTISQELVVQADGCEVGTSFGQIEIASTDGAFDDAFSQRIFDGLGVRVYRGRTGIDTKLRRMVPVATANLGVPSMSPESISFDVYDGSLVLQRRVTTKMVAAYHGESLTTDINNNPVPDTILPRVYGVLRRVPAYRTVNGASDSTFTICDTTAGSLQSMGVLAEDTGTFSNKCYYDAEKSAFTVNISSTSLSACTFKVTSSASAEHYRDDVLYVDINGPVTDASEWFSGVGSGVPINTPGLIMLDILRRAGVPIDMVDRQSFRLLDRRWRMRRTPDGVETRPIEMGFAFYEETVAEALNIIARHAFVFWGQTRTGRFRVGVPEVEAQNMVVNPGFELSSSEIHPWFLADGASSTMSTATKFYGSRALQVSNGKNGTVAQRVLFPRAGRYAVTCLLSAQTGDGSFVRLSVVKPGNGFKRVLSETFDVPSTKWIRTSMLVEIDEDESGSGVVEVVPCLPSQYAPEDPPLYDALVSWFRPETLLGESGSLVEQWQDSSSSNLTAQNTDTATQPTLINDAIAGYPAIHLREGKTNLAFVPPTMTVEQCCIFVVAMLHTNSIDGGDRNLVTLDNSIRVGINPGFFVNYWSARVKASTHIDATGVTIRDYAPTVLMFRKVSSSSSELYVNGVLAGSSSASSQYTVLDRFWYIGADPLSSNAADLNAGGFYVSEVMVYRTNLSTARIAVIHEYLLNKYGIRDVSLNIDNVEVLPVSAAVLASDGAGTHARNASVQGYETRQEHYYEAAVPMNTYIARPEFLVKRIVVSDNEARGIQASYDATISEALASLQTAGRLSIEPESAGGVSALSFDAAARSAGTVANALALRFSRQGAQALIKYMDFERIPEVGELMYHEPVKRMGASSSDNPIWQILKIDDTSPAATEIELTVERPIDPVFDRSVIVPSEIPIGGIVLVIGAGQTCPTDYSEVTEMRGFYAAGMVGAPNITSEFGSAAHTHALSHTHAVTGHTHTATMGSTTSTGLALGRSGQETQDDYWDVSGEGPEMGASHPLDPIAGGHTHDVTSTSITAAQQVNTTSNAPVTVPSTYRGTNDVKHRRVLFCRRVARTASSATIDTKIVMGYAPAGVPAGWKACDGTSSTTDMVGCAPRGADAAAISATTTQSITQNDSGTIIPLSSITDDAYSLYDRVTVTNGANTFAGIITGADFPAKTLTVLPLHETGNTANGTVYASGSTVAIATRVVGTLVTPSDHAHYYSGSGGTTDIAAHIHTNAHNHTSITGTTPTIAAPDNTFDVPYAYQTPSRYGTSYIVMDAHTHTISQTGFTAQSTASSAAGGTMTSATQNNPDSVVLGFITPTTGNETLIPTGAVMFFSGPACPAGWETIREASDRLVVGGSSANALTTTTVGHSHAFTAEAHTNSHTHGGTKAYTDRYSGSTYGVAAYGGSRVLTATETNSAYTLTGHAHSLTVSNQSTTDGPLIASSATSSVATGRDAIPKSRRLLLCKKT